MELKDINVSDHVEILQSDLRFKGPIFTIYDDEIKFASGDIARRQYMEHHDAVAIVPMRESERGPEILLIRQYRHAPRRILWEIPAGLLDIAGEDALSTAKRELLEETDCVADRWTKLARFTASPGVSDENCDIFLARDVYEVAHSQFERSEEEREIIKKWFLLEDVLDAIFRSDLTSPTLVTGVLAAVVALERGA
ncbi:MAG: NUDIX hydrolase [Actinomycetaceae bacterium]|nr:NUDIX hydrolase [Actinomycetaceae bacterium]